MLLLALFFFCLHLLRSCSAQCDLSAVQLVTFDIFAALSDTLPSLTAAVSASAPAVGDPPAFVLEWVNAYGASAGASFTPAQVSPYPQPFPYVIRGGLDAALAARSLTATYPPGSPAYEALAAAWGSSLQPYADTAQALSRLASAGLALATLSNADAATQANATAPLPVPFAYFFTSDFPTGAFKPRAEVFAQALASTGLNASQVLIIEGSPGNAAAAREQGLLSGLVGLPPGFSGL